jgi:hypothetical protein
VTCLSGENSEQYERNALRSRTLGVPVMVMDTAVGSPSFMNPFHFLRTSSSQLWTLSVTAKSASRKKERKPVSLGPR